MQRSSSTFTITNELLLLTYQYLSSQTIYLAIQFNIFSVENKTFTVASHQKTLQNTYHIQLTDEALQRILNVLCAYELLKKDGHDRYYLTSDGLVLSDKTLQAVLLANFIQHY